MYCCDMKRSPTRLAFRHGFLLLFLVVVLWACPTLSQWTSKLPLPQPIRGSSTVSSGSMVFVLGGFDVLYNHSKVVYAFDTAIDIEWIQIATLPKPISGSSFAVIHKSHIAVAYGANAVGTGLLHNASTEVHLLDLSTGNWSSISNATYSRKGAAAINIRGVMWLIGGMREDNTPVKAVERYSFDDHRWLPLNGTFTDPVGWETGCGCSAAVSNNFIYLLGCLVCGTTLTSRRDALKINLMTGVWSVFGQRYDHHEVNPFHQYNVIMGTATVAEYAIAIAPRMFDSPEVIFFNMMLEQVMSDVFIGDFMERNDASVGSNGATVFVNGGMDIYTTQSVNNVDSFNFFPVPSISCGRQNSTYAIGETVELLTSLASSASSLRLSRSPSCQPYFGGKNEDSEVVPMASNQVTFPAPDHVGTYHLCLSNGFCPLDRKDRKPCTSYTPNEKSMISCLALYCCWDSEANQCFSYAPTNDTSLLYWVPVSTLQLRIEPRITEPPQTPVPSTAHPTPQPTTSAPTTESPTPPPTTVTPQPTTLAPTTNAPSGNKSSASHNFLGLSTPYLFGIGSGIFVVLVGSIGLTIMYCSCCNKKQQDGDDGTEKRPLLNHIQQQAQATTSKYKILSKLGKGAHGTVYLVQRNSDLENFALKYIACENDADLQVALKEFQVIRNVQGHENMIALVDMFMNWSEMIEPAKKNSTLRSLPTLEGSLQTHGPFQELVPSPIAAVGEDGEQPRYVCIVMEYFPEGDLKQWILRHPAPLIPTRDVLNVATQLCSLLEFLHSRKPPIVHRDIKPENILVNADRAVVTDFGLAHNADKTHMTTRAGTLHYAAPEAWKRHYTSSIDMWSVGCIIYVLCTRRVSSGNARIMFSDVLDDTFADEVRDEMRNFPDALVTLALELLSTDPTKRPTASEARQRLMALTSS